jgi:hypothetical protein
MRVEDMVSQLLITQKLDLFPQNEFSDIVRIAVEKDDRDAIESFVKQSITRIMSGVRDAALEREAIKTEIERSKKLREDEWQRLHPGIEELLASMPMTRIVRSDQEDADLTDKEDSPELKTNGRGRGRVRGGGRGGGRGRGGDGDGNGNGNGDGANRGRIATIHTPTTTSQSLNTSTKRRATGGNVGPILKQPKLNLIPNVISINSDEENVPETPPVSTPSRRR